MNDHLFCHCLVIKVSCVKSRQHIVTPPIAVPRVVFPRNIKQLADFIFILVRLLQHKRPIHRHRAQHEVITKKITIHFKKLLCRLKADIEMPCLHRYRREIIPIHREELELVAHRFNPRIDTSVIIILKE